MLREPYLVIVIPGVFLEVFYHIQGVFEGVRRFLVVLAEYVGDSLYSNFFVYF
jgi:hypothetical protein